MTYSCIVVTVTRIMASTHLITMQYCTHSLRPPFVAYRNYRRIIRKQ